MRAKTKTPDYTRRAIEKYREKHDIIQMQLPKGTRGRALAVGMAPKDMAALVLAEIDRREAEKSAGDGVNP